MPSLHLATFESDVTPPLGHPLCGGWIEPVRGVDDPLQALGVVLLGMGEPVVVCAVDWVGLRNEANWAWREALAKAAHTTPEKVCIHCVHPHDSPFADVEAQRLIAATPGAPISLDIGFFDDVVKRSAAAVQQSLARTAPFTHIGLGQARVEKVASNRRVVGPDGKIRLWRGSSARLEAARDEPEGLIDPMLKTLSFWNGSTPLAALHYYATHPMSHYGKGRVSSDFCGLARKKMQAELPGVRQVYFTGCSGNIAAGKYNDGNPENRPVLSDRMFAGMKASWASTARHAIDRFEMRIEPVKLPPRSEAIFGAEVSRTTLADEKATKAKRNNAALQLAWLSRTDRPIEVTCLDLGKAMVLHLPGEPFIEYQLKAQELRKDSFVCVAGYGDGGPGYLPTERAYAEGGYETTVALAGPGSERILHAAMSKLMRSAK